ncbi:lysozyme inhibitor LprI family protein [Flavobacterium panacagri]|uniref:lysozyme inhibitor LprI family protein n=1 Tax=Flavobacterium panacagri TaxID=3034146 RepID=UPI0025A632F6|nr:lysozyme inhibitor LprI family protein [Flavobacterium panacagri]
MIKKTLLVLFALISFKSNSQTLETVSKMKSNYQKCLDRGNNMSGCSINYYNQSDSLLNVVYKNLKEKISSKEQSKLKKEQLEWLKKRDLYFEKVYADTKKEGHFIEGTRDFEMVVFDEKANFVFGRVKELIKRN